MKTINDLSPSHSERDKRFPPLNQSRLRVFGISMVIVWLLVWELSSQSGLDQRYIVPPSVILRSFYRSVLVTGELRTHIWATVTRLVGGLVVGAIPAMWLGLVMGRNEHAWLRYSLLVAALGLIPVIASFPFSIVMFGVGDFQKGVQISRTLQAAANSPVEGVIRSDWLRGPGPWIFTGLKMGSVIGLATLLGVEMHTSTRGLGFEIVVAMANLNLVRAYVGMFAAALVMYALWLCLTSIELMWTKSSMA